MVYSFPILCIYNYMYIQLYVYTIIWFKVSIRTCKIVDFAVPADHKIKLKECEKKDKYVDLARELKKPCNMQRTIIPILIGEIGTVTKGLVKGVEDLQVGGRVEIIQTTTLLRSGRILRRVLETCCHANSSEKQSTNADVKNSREVC